MKRRRFHVRLVKGDWELIPPNEIKPVNEARVFNVSANKAAEFILHGTELYVGPPLDADETGTNWVFQVNPTSAGYTILVSELSDE